MKGTIELFTSLTGWAGSAATVTAHALNEIPAFIAGLNSESLIVKFASGSLNEYIIKTPSSAIDVSDYNEIVFHLWSRNKRRAGMNYKKSSDYVYKIDFGNDNIFYIPTYDTFSDISLDISGISEITQIKITALHNDEDYIILSNMVGVKDEIPRDIFVAVKEGLEEIINNEYAKETDGVQDKGILIGQVSGSKDDTYIIYESSLSIIDNYAVVKIESGSNSETHQIMKTDEGKYQFNSMYDGDKLLYDHTDANVYLVTPAEYGLTESEIILPGISIDGMVPEEVYRTQKEDVIYDTFKANDTVSVRQSDILYQYDITMDCEARGNEMLAFISRCVRILLAKQVLWVNGKKIEMWFEGTPTFVPPVEGYNEIPKIVYIARVHIREQLFDRTYLVKQLTTNQTIEVVEQGEI